MSLVKIQTQVCFKRNKVQRAHIHNIYKTDKQWPNIKCNTKHHIQYIFGPAPLLLLQWRTDSVALKIKSAEFAVKKAFFWYLRSYLLAALSKEAGLVRPPGRQSPIPALGYDHTIQTPSCALRQTLTTCSPLLASLVWSVGTLSDGLGPELTPAYS